MAETLFLFKTSKKEGGMILLAVQPLSSMVPIGTAQMRLQLLPEDCSIIVKTFLGTIQFC